MKITIERILCVGVTKTRFDLFDDIAMTLKSGRTINGRIIDMGDKHVVLDRDGAEVYVFVDEIEDCTDLVN